MLSIDWRSPAAYQHAEGIPAAGFAWEYLRRDDDYHRDFQKIERLRKPAARIFETLGVTISRVIPTRRQISSHCSGYQACSHKPLVSL